MCGCRNKKTIAQTTALKEAVFGMQANNATASTKVLATAAKPFIKSSLPKAMTVAKATPKATVVAKVKSATMAKAVAKVFVKPLAKATPATTVVSAPKAVFDQAKALASYPLASFTPSAPVVKVSSTPYPLTSGQRVFLDAWGRAIRPKAPAQALTSATAVEEEKV